MFCLISDDIRQGFKSFTTPATYKQSLRDVSGSRTLTEYSTHECDESHIQSLRDCGLTDQEIHLWLQYGDTDGYVVGNYYTDSLCLCLILDHILTESQNTDQMITASISFRNLTLTDKLENFLDAVVVNFREV